MSWVTLCKIDEIEIGKAKAVDVDGYRLAVFADGDFYAVLDSVCPHAGQSITGGWVDRGCAVCPFHAWAFDLRTGDMRDSPGVTITRYDSRVVTHGDDRWVQAILPSI